MQGAQSPGNRKQIVPGVIAQLHSNAEKNKLELYKVETTNLYNEKINIQNQEFSIRKVLIGTGKYDTFDEKVILLVGGTGAGKTTMLNSLANFLLEINDTENYRVLVDDDSLPNELTKDQTQSQTNGITAYCFPPMKNKRIRVTIVDTPGFAHTDGQNEDQKIINIVEFFFQLDPVFGINHVNAIAFVAHSGDIRLTKQQRYILENCVNLFGADMKNNIVCLASHHTGESDEIPRVVEAMKKIEINICGYYVFENSIVTKPIDNYSKKEKWNMFKNSANEFINKKLLELKNISLTMSTEALREKKKLHIISEKIPDVISSIISKIIENQKLQEQIANHSAEMIENKNFTIERQVVETTTVDIGSEQAMVCKYCHTTCDYPCSCWFYNGFCDVFQNGVCTQCHNNCGTNRHSREHFLYNNKFITKMETISEIQEKYNIANKNLNRELKLSEKIKQEQRVFACDLISKIFNAMKIVSNLQTSALKPKYNDVDMYIKELMEKEKNKNSSNWEMRVGILETIRNYLINHNITASSKEVNIDLFQKISDQIQMFLLKTKNKNIDNL